MPVWLTSPVLLTDNRVMIFIHRLFLLALHHVEQPDLGLRFCLRSMFCMEMPGLRIHHRIAPRMLFLNPIRHLTITNQYPLLQVVLSDRGNRPAHVSYLAFP